MRTARSILVTALILALPAGVLTAPAAAQTASVKAVLVKGNLQNPVGFTFDPGGRIWYIEKDSGEIRVLNPSTGADRLFYDIPGVRADANERGGLGVALHPSWPTVPYVYAYATRNGPGGVAQNQLLSIRAEAGKGVGFTVLFRFNVSAGNHNGGRIVFGPDGYLWIVTGDNAVPSTSQDLSNIRGKILRIRPNGAAAPSNPFGTRVWAYGIRNSFGMAFDPQTGRLWETENGPTCNDEINLIVKAGNYAWGPSYDCPANPTVFDTNADGPEPRRLPKWRYVDPIGITGTAFCAGCGLGPSFVGDLLFGDVTRWVRAVDLDAARTGFASAPRTVLRLPTAVYSMERAPDGRLFVSGPTGIWRLAPA